MPPLKLPGQFATRILKKREFDEKDGTIDKKEKLGKGGQGTVYLVRHRSLGNVAIKELNCGKLGQADTNRLLKEAAHMLELNHKNILPLLGVIWEDECYALVLPYMPLGNLKDFIATYGVSEHIKVDFSSQISCGMAFLQSESLSQRSKRILVHRDLKCQNLLVNMLKEEVTIKICDLGLCEWRSFHFTSSQIDHTLSYQEGDTYKAIHTGTIHHIPPEKFKDINCRASEKYDVYSFAITLWEMFTEETPFQGCLYKQIEEAVKNKQRPCTEEFDDKCSFEEIKTLIKRCWHDTPILRPSFEEISKELRRFRSTIVKDLETSLTELIQQIMADHPETSHSGAAAAEDDLAAGQDQDDMDIMDKEDQNVVRNEVDEKRDAKKTGTAGSVNLDVHEEAKSASVSEPNIAAFQVNSGSNAVQNQTFVGLNAISKPNDGGSAIQKRSKDDTSSNKADTVNKRRSESYIEAMEQPFLENSVDLRSLNNNDIHDLQKKSNELRNMISQPSSEAQVQHKKTDASHKIPGKAQESCRVTKENFKSYLLERGFSITTPETPADGNCLFHAIGKQLSVLKNLDIFNHTFMRSILIEYMGFNKERIKNLAQADLIDQNVTWDHYIHNMKQNGTWGDQIVILAAAMLFKCDITIVTTSSEKPITIGPPTSSDEEKENIYIGHMMNNHFMAIDENPEVAAICQGNDDRISKSDTDTEHQQLLQQQETQKQVEQQAQQLQEMRMQHQNMQQQLLQHQHQMLQKQEEQLQKQERELQMREQELMMTTRKRQENVNQFFQGQGNDMQPSLMEPRLKPMDYAGRPSHDTEEVNLDDGGEAFIDVHVKKIDLGNPWMQRQLNSEGVYKIGSSGSQRRALIINNENFLGFARFNDREGSAFDMLNLDSLLTQMGFETTVKQDLTAQGIAEAVNYECRSQHAQADSFVMAIFSHGARGSVYGTDGTSVPIQDITDRFDGRGCPALRGKPKLFIIQACQGRESTQGVVQADAAYCETEDEPSTAAMIFRRGNENERPWVTTEGVMVHEKADMLVAYSTVQGYKSWRNPVEGSWFVRSLVRIFMHYAHEEHVLELLTRVRDAVARKQTGMTGSGSGLYIQMTQNEDTLRKKWYFFPGLPQKD